GHDGFAGELGHTCAIKNGRACGCGQKGCLEAYCSATGVARTAKEMLEKSDRPSLLREYNDITSKDVFDAAEKGDEMAKEIFEYTGKVMGEKFADFIPFSAPEAIILFGGLTHAKDYFMEYLVDAMNENVVFLWKGKVKVLVSALNESDAAILGASALAW
ncbi:MAG: ROK family protein, partial [Bacteroidales bacterium]|nr:ROK family protein [Bacteroidales bacterium]